MQGSDKRGIVEGMTRNMPLDEFIEAYETNQIKWNEISRESQQAYFISCYNTLFLERSRLAACKRQNDKLVDEAITLRLEIAKAGSQADKAIEAMDQMIDKLEAELFTENNDFYAQARALIADLRSKKNG